MNDLEVQNQIDENVVNEKSNKTLNKSVNFFLLGMVVVAAAAITGLGIYYFANIRQRESSTNNATATSQSMTSADSSGENSFEFYDVSLKLSYTLPKQASYKQSEYQVLDIECAEEDAICKDISEIDAMPAEWVVEETQIPPYNFFLEPEVEFYGLRFSLLSGRFDNAQLGCDGICNSKGVIVVRSFVSDSTLEDAFRSLVSAHNEAYASFAEQNSADLSAKLLERGQKWNLETFKVSLPVPFDSANFEENYLTKSENRIILVSIYYDTTDYIQQINTLINSFKFN